MFTIALRRAAETRTFTIAEMGPSGWKVTDAMDSRVIKQTLYDDWHRVERARAVFTAQAAILKDLGWSESSYSTNR